MKLDDPRVLRREYASEERLLARRLDRWAALKGDDPRAVAVTALAEIEPARVLDAGCGPGELAECIAREVGCVVVGADQSPRMVELTRERGVDAVVADIDSLPFDDAAFDAVVASWVLNHLPDLDRGLAELMRVLRPRGRLVVVGNGEAHLVELWGLLREGDPNAVWLETELACLRRLFERVEQRDVHWIATFPDRAAILGYLRGFDVLAGEPLWKRMPEVDVPLRVHGHNVVLVATS